MDNATWAATRTGKVFHSFGVAHAECRKNIKPRSNFRYTEAEIDRCVASPEEHGTQGYRKCEKCTQLEADFQKSMQQREDKVQAFVAGDRLLSGEVIATAIQVHEHTCQSPLAIDHRGNPVGRCGDPAVEYRPDRMLVRYVCSAHL